MTLEPRSLMAWRLSWPRLYHRKSRGKVARPPDSAAEAPLSRPAKTRALGSLFRDNRSEAVCHSVYPESAENHQSSSENRQTKKRKYLAHYLSDSIRPECQLLHKSRSKASRKCNARQQRHTCTTKPLVAISCPYFTGMTAFQDIQNFGTPSLQAGPSDYKHHWQSCLWPRNAQAPSRTIGSFRRSSSVDSQPNCSPFRNQCQSTVCKTSTGTGEE
ncbi:hypothetical protein BDV06DRAFT_67674 [Aspergillus oleicola]